MGATQAMALWWKISKLYLPIIRIRFFNQHFVQKPVRVVSPIVMPDFQRI